MVRRLALLASLAVLGGCAALDDMLASLHQDRAVPVPLDERPRDMPIDPNRFELASPDQSVIGEPQLVFTGAEDTLSDLARAYGLGYDEIVAANPGIDPWLPGENTPILLPTQFVLPDVPRHGLVLNIATKRLFYFPETKGDAPQVVLTYPIGIGRVGWETPLGETQVTGKARDPHWWVPASVRREHAEMGNPLPDVVPPGPDNPLGNRVLQLDMPGYLIHGTNQPYGVGMRVSHGCIRLYPENIEFLYPLVAIGTPVRIINEPYLLGRRDGEVYFEAHVPLADDPLSPDARLDALLDAPGDAANVPLNPHLRDHVRSLSREPRGMPLRIAHYDADEVLSRVRVVHNIVEPDPAAPSLSEVRELMDEVAQEIEREKTEAL